MGVVIMLQVEARSVNSLKKLNKGMEKKVIQLQLKLTCQVSRTSLSRTSESC